jgi:dienelactone hydrolase
MSIRVLAYAAFTGVLTVQTAPPPIWNGLQAGPYPVGISAVERGSMKGTLWYPAEGEGKGLTIGALVTSAAAFADEAGVDGLPADVISRYASRQLLARADALRAPGKFPLVVIAQGNQQRSLHQAVLAEFLSSHGFVVVTTTSTTVGAPMRTADDVGPAAQREAEQLQALVSLGRALPEVDGSRVLVVAHSFGARAALLLAMHDPTIGALVSLDGGIGTAQSMESYRRASWFAKDRATLPILHFYETADEFMAPEFTLLRGLPSTSLTLRKAEGLHHVHFTTLGLAAVLDPVLAKAVQLESSAARALVGVFQELLSFLQTRPPR